MPPLGSSALFLAEAETIKYEYNQPEINNKALQKSDEKKTPANQTYYKWDIVWRNVIAFVYLHVFALVGLYSMFFEAQWKTGVWAMFVLFLGSQGVTAGAHRLWAHKSYKAKLPLRIILMICQTIAFQNHIYEWSRDHRVHHKYTDTNADPHNASRGFFFSHIGWLMVKKHPDVIIKGKCVDLSDLEEDAVVMFQKKYYAILMPLFCFVLPAVIPVYLWGEDGMISWNVAAIMRYTLQLNGTWLVNSAAHLYGTKPYDKKIGPAQNTFVAVVAFGEGWHNYHHVFPWDYKTDEYNDYAMNITKGVIDLFAKIGWAYDLKTVTPEMIDQRAKRTGDGSRIELPDKSRTEQPNRSKIEQPSRSRIVHHEEPPESYEDLEPQEHVWGWDDPAMDESLKKQADIHNRLS